MKIRAHVIEELLNCEIDPTARICFRISGKTFGLFGVRPSTDTEIQFFRSEQLILDSFRSLLICSTLLNDLNPQVAGFASDYYDRLADYLSYDRLAISIRAALKSALPANRQTKLETLRQCVQSSHDQTINLLGQYNNSTRMNYKDKRAYLNSLEDALQDEIELVVLETKRNGRFAKLPPAVNTENDIYYAWKTTKKRLQRRSETWKVWVDWYQYRFLGENSAEVPNALWKSIEMSLAKNKDFLTATDPIIVNGIFAEAIISEVTNLVDYQATHQVSNIAATFRFDDRQVYVTPSEVNTVESLNQSALNELIRSISVMREECKKNSASFLKDELEDYAVSISPNGWADVIPFAVRGDLLRRSLDAIQAKPVDSDLPDLSDRTLLSFRNLVRAHNFVVSIHPEVKHVDDHLREGINTYDVDPLEKIRDISGLYRSKVTIDAKSRETLDFLSNRLLTDNNVERKRLVAFGIIANFVQSSSAWIWSNRKKIVLGGITTGTAVFTAASWMVANEIWLLSTFPLNSSIGALVRSAMEILRSLPIL